jgi:hypothetical protein
MDPTTRTRSNKEATRKPYRSNTATYEEYKKEIPDANYYGLKHYEFKKPWLPGESYDEMEYKFDFPLDYINPITVDFDWPDGFGYPFPDGIPYDPKWNQPGWNPNYPMPDPRPSSSRRTSPKNSGSQITWDCDPPFSFEFCPGEDVVLVFEEARDNPITSIEGEGGEISIDRSRVPAGSAMGTRQVTIRIPENYTDTFYTVNAITRQGSTCSVTGTMKSYCNESACDGVALLYTSSQMTVGTSQTISISNPKPDVVYEYRLTGGGTITETGDGSAIYTAPADNPGCVNNATIEVAVKGTAQICATLKIGIGDPANYYGIAYIVYNPCTLFVGPLPKLCSDMGDIPSGTRVTADPFQAYYCDDTIATSWRPDCGVQSSSVYSNPLSDLYYMAFCESHHELIGTVDVRNESQKMASCCPSALA